MRMFSPFPQEFWLVLRSHHFWRLVFVNCGSEQQSSCCQGLRRGREKLLSSCATGRSPSSSTCWWLTSGIPLGISKSNASRCSMPKLDTVHTQPRNIISWFRCTFQEITRITTRRRDKGDLSKSQLDRTPRNFRATAKGRFASPWGSWNQLSERRMSSSDTPSRHMFTYTIG